MFLVKKYFIFYTALFFSLPIFVQPVHVLMPVYNSEQYLPQSIDSVLMQESDDVVLIVYDDGSTDHSRTVLESYAKRYPSKITYFGMGENRGIAHAREALLRASFTRDETAFILWLDSDDCFTSKTFVTRFVDQMEKTGADVCLFTFDVVLENPSDKANLAGLLDEKHGHEEVLDALFKSESQVVSPSNMNELMNVSTLGWTKGYRQIHWPHPEDCCYEDFVYMAALFNADAITALPSTYKPIQHLRRAQSTTGRRTAKTFQDVLTQLEKCVHEILVKKRIEQKRTLIAFLQRKIAQYEALLQQLVSSTEHPDITEDTLTEYRFKAAEIISRASQEHE